MNDRPMMEDQHIRRINNNSALQFSCHSGVRCFTECCRMLELALTPYDVLRLRKATGKTSMQLLEEVIIVEQEPGEPFPRFYLSMVDDGRASCIYVRPQGCSVYHHRPGACRAYPLGRAAVCSDSPKAIKEHFVLIEEAHCLGFMEDKLQTVHEYCENQGLNSYNRFNDEVAQILQHQAVRAGFIPSAKQVELFTLALYNIDLFRQQMVAGELADAPLPPTIKDLVEDDESLLLFAIRWLKDRLFVL